MEMELDLMVVVPEEGEWDPVVRDMAGIMHSPTPDTSEDSSDDCSEAAMEEEEVWEEAKVRATVEDRDVEWAAAVEEDEVAGEQHAQGRQVSLCSSVHAHISQSCWDT